MTPQLEHALNHIKNIHPMVVDVVKKEIATYENVISMHQERWEELRAFVVDLGDASEILRFMDCSSPPPKPDAHVREIEWGRLRDIEKSDTISSLKNKRKSIQGSIDAIRTQIEFIAAVLNERLDHE